VSHVATGGAIGNDGFYRIDGIDDYLDVPGSAGDTAYRIGSSHPITITVWVRADLSGGNDNARYMMTGANDAPAPGYSLNLSKGGTTQSYVARAGDGSRRIGDGSTGLDVEQWHLTAGVFTLNPPTLSAQIYWDAGETAAGATSMGTGWDPIPNNQELNMGRHHPNAPFKGDIDDPAVWNAALTQAEIAGLYNVGLNTNLNYTAGEFDYLKTVHDAGYGPGGEIGGRTWYFRTGLGGAGGSLTETGGHFTLVLDSAARSGVSTLNPTSGSLLILQ
jgi:hypothetical protein